MSPPGNTLGTSVHRQKGPSALGTSPLLFARCNFHPGRVVPRPKSSQNSVYKNGHNKLITKSASKCHATIAYFCTPLKTPQTAAGLGRRKISQLRTPGGVQASCAYRRTPVGRVQGVAGCAFVRAWLCYTTPAFKFGHVFFGPGLNRPICPVKSTIIHIFL